MLVFGIRVGAMPATGSPVIGLPFWLKTMSSVPSEPALTVWFAVGTSETSMYGVLRCESSIAVNAAWVVRFGIVLPVGVSTRAHALSIGVSVTCVLEVTPVPITQ